MKTSFLRAGLLPVLALALTAGCQSTIEQLSITRSWTDARCGMQPYGDGDGLPDRQALYYSVVEYPESYDWHRDTAFGMVDCTIRLMRDSVEVVSFAAGKGRGISPEADTHFIFDGHVYTVFGAGGLTVVCRDGKRQFSYACGQEELRGFTPRPEGVYCLSQDGDELVLRRDGTVLERKQEAIVFGRLDESPTDPSGALYIDRDELCYAFQKKGVFYLSHGEKVLKLERPDFVPEVKRVRRIGGVMYYLGVRDGEVCICAPDIPLSAAHFGSVAESDLYLGACTGMPFFTSSYVRASATMVDFCNPLLRLMREKCMSFYPLEMQSGLSCLMVTESGLRGRDGRGGEFELEGMRLPSVRCCTFAGGSLHMALKRGGQSWLWSDGELKEVGCNGYISCLTAGQ